MYNNFGKYFINGVTKAYRAILLNRFLGLKFGNQIDVSLI